MLRTRCLPRAISHCDSGLPAGRGRLRFLSRRKLVTLAIESSCDDTSVAVLEKHDESGDATLHFHEKVTADNKVFKGINPKVALNSHRESLALLVQRGLDHLPHAKNGRQIGAHASRQLDFISVTRGPGLLSCVATGLDTAKGLSLALNVPVVGVNHMQAHALTPRLVSSLEGRPHDQVQFPFMSLLISGGHTMVLASESLTSHRILANTVDVAAGDALDKMARMILQESTLEASKDVSYARALESFVFSPTPPLEYDYRPPVTRLDAVTPREQPEGWSLPIPLANTRGRKKIPTSEMSFTGLVSAVERLCDERGSVMSIDERKRVGFEAMRLTFEHVANRIIAALETVDVQGKQTSGEDGHQMATKGICSLVASGGVAANRFLRCVLRSYLDAKGFGHVRVEFPPLEFCTDNAAMIAWAGMEMYQAGWESQLSCLPLRRWTLDPEAEDGGILGVGGWRKVSARDI